MSATTSDHTTNTAQRAGATHTAPARFICDIARWVSLSPYRHLKVRFFSDMCKHFNTFNISSFNKLLTLKIWPFQIKCLPSECWENKNLPKGKDETLEYNLQRALKYRTYCSLIFNKFLTLYIWPIQKVYLPFGCQVKGIDTPTSSTI